MKAILLEQPGDHDKMYLGEIPKPSLADNEVLVQIKAAALNRADILQRRGLYPPPPGASDILGMEIAGTVVDSNKYKKDLLGKNVMAMISGGAYAEYAAIPGDLLLPVPENLTLTEAAGVMEAFLTGWQALKWLSDLKHGEKVLIHAGASGVGSACIQLAKSMGALVVITASGSKLDFCRELGADYCINYQNTDFSEVVKRRWNAVHVIIDFIGASYFQQNLESLEKDGRMVMLGLLSGLKPPAVNLSPILFNRLTIMGSTLRSRSLDYRVRLVQDFKQHCYHLLQAGSIKPIIDTVFHWYDVGQAHQYMEANRNKGKIVLEVK